MNRRRTLHRDMDSAAWHRELGGAYEQLSQDPLQRAAPVSPAH